MTMAWEGSEATRAVVMSPRSSPGSCGKAPRSLSPSFFLPTFLRSLLLFHFTTMHLMKEEEMILWESFGENSLKHRLHDCQSQSEAACSDLSWQTWSPYESQSHKEIGEWWSSREVFHIIIHQLTHEDIRIVSSWVTAVGMNPEQAIWGHFSSLGLPYLLFWEEATVRNKQTRRFNPWIVHRSIRLQDWLQSLL